MIIVDGLRDDDVKRFRNQGLRNLVRIIVDEVRTVGPGRILINATGGYKAQISFAGIIGQALGIPVCYLFERFSEVIELPPQPISLDMVFWLKHVDVFNSLDGGWELERPFQPPDERFTGLVECEEVNGAYLAALSPVGQLFHDSLGLRFVQKSKNFLPSDSGLNPEDKEAVYEDGNPHKHRGLEAYVKRLFQVPYVKRAYTHYYNPDLPRPNRFRRSAKGEVEKVEAWYHHSGKLTKIDLYTTAQTQEQRDACIADLCERFRIE